MILEDQVALPQRARRSIDSAIPLLCWNCRSTVIANICDRSDCADLKRCPTCGVETVFVDGIWRTLSPEREAGFRRFTNQYEFIREAEGRGSQGDEYYLALPFDDLSRRNTSQWKIRARTYAHLLKNVIQPMANERRVALRILDLGSGNGWLSYRLSLLGHSLIAADLLVNSQDGLGATIHYTPYIQPLFPSVQTDMNELPFPDSTFDLVIFNASYHYSSDYSRTLQEALRCTSSEGSIVIADSAWYAREESGEAMVKEKHAAFRAKYGFPSDALASLEYLTPTRIEYLINTFNLDWNVLKPFHGMRWAVRPLIAKLKRRRIPSQFFLHVVRVKQ